MTSNIGVKKLQDFGVGMGFKSNTSTYAQEEEKKEILRKELQKFFAPEFLNRIDETIIFNSLQKEDISRIVEIELIRLFDRLKNIKYNFTYNSDLVNLISEEGFDEVYGARPLKRAIQDKIEDFISEEVLKGNVLENEEYQIVVEEKTIKIDKKLKKKNKLKS
jgi:ATP-dependent Clp protease ATP-binding subunit ClpC